MLMQQASILRFPYVDPPEHIVHYTLEDILPKESCFALHWLNSSLSLLTIKDAVPHLVAEEKFTHMEMRVLRPLLAIHPYFATHSVMYASYWFDSMSEISIEKALHRLREADAANILDMEMRPIRNHIHRVRTKMHTFDIDIVATLKVGWSFQRYREGFFAHG